MKNYTFLILGIIYFTYYYLNKDNSALIESTKSIYWGDIILSYVSALVGAMTCLGLIGLINNKLDVILTKLTKKSKSLLDDIIGSFIVKFINIAKYVASFYLFFYIAKVPKYIKEGVDEFSSVILSIVFLVLLSNFVNIIFQKELIMKNKLKAINKTLLPFVNKIIIAVIWIIGIISILSNLGYNVSALIAGAGIGGIAVALAAQKTISNMFGAVIILLNKPFKIGDTIIINNHTGVVKEIGLSYTTLFDKFGHQVMISNDTIISTSIENLTIRKNRRTDFTIGVVYGTTLEKMQEGVRIIEKILEKYVKDETIGSFRVNFDMFGDFSLNINITYFSLINDDFKKYLKQKEQINLEIKKEFEKSGIDMAFPTQELILKKED
ncbi:hypothetical protein CSA08_03225 [Candidatus Gracilibacteria bacterium]|nr:MAG: hypothetical protein CSA08_03225 [Candidatus Gracilibacteria bacterium]